MTVEEFLELLDRSQLVRSRQLETMRTRVLAEGQWNAKEFANSLVESGHLTRWQSERLLSRKAGFQLGKYKLVDRIGVGGMAVVLKGKQSGMNRTVAIKVLARTLLKRQDAVRRFFREIEAASSLDHPNIVRAIDSDCIDGVPFLVMEFVEGRDLHSLTQQRGPMAIPWAAEFCRQAALGLQHAHEHHVVHRDIKPANLLVTRKSPAEPLTVKILDFGLARFASDTPDAGSLTAAHQIFGTVDFISPEQARSARSADIRSDIFSLGCTLYFLLTGKPPFRGETAMEKLTARIADGPTPITELRPDVPPELKFVLEKMLAREPGDRYQTPAEVAIALEPFSAAMSDGAEATVLTRKAEDRGIADAAGKESELALENFLGQISQLPIPSESGESIVTLGRSRFRRLFAVLFLALLLFAAILAARSNWTTLNRRDSQSTQRSLVTPASRVPQDDSLRKERTVDAVNWSDEAEGLNVAWQSGMEDHLTGSELALVWKLELRDGARFDNQGSLILAPGAAVVHGPEASLTRDCRQSGEFSLEIVLTPEGSGKGLERILTLQAGRNQKDFQLVQMDQRLFARLQTPLTQAGRSTGEFELCRLTPGIPRHLLVSYRDGQIVCYLDGEKVSERDDVRGPLTPWNCEQIVLGNAGKPGRPWSGAIERFALFHQFHSLESARARFLLSRAPKRGATLEN